MHIKLNDLLVYVAISLAIIAGSFGLFAIGLTWDHFIKWVGFVAVTSILAWIFYTGAETHLRQERYFARINIALLMLHCIVWLVILTLVDHWKFVWFMPMLIEVAALLPLRRALVKWLGSTDE